MTTIGRREAAADASVDEAAGASGRHLAKDYLRYYGVRQIYTISLPRRADRRAFMRRRAAAIRRRHVVRDLCGCKSMQRVSDSRAEIEAACIHMVGWCSLLPCSGHRTESNRAVVLWLIADDFSGVCY